MKNYVWMLIAAVLLSCSAVASEKVDVSGYVGVQQVSVEAYGETGDVVGGVIGVSVEDKAGIEFSLQSDGDLKLYQFQLVGAILSGYMQRLTWQLGADYVSVNATLVEEDHDSFWHYGLGYEFRPVKAMTLRAQYNRLQLDDDNGTDHPDAVQLSVLYNF